MAVKIIISLLVAIFIQVTVVKADECVTVDSYVSGLAKEGIALRGSTAAATKKLAKLFNQNRAARGQPAAEVSIFIFGLVTADNGNQAILAAVADKNGCVIPKTVTLLSLRQWAEFMTIAGVSISEIVPMDGA